VAQSKQRARRRYRRGRSRSAPRRQLKALPKVGAIFSSRWKSGGLVLAGVNAGPSARLDGAARSYNSTAAVLSGPLSLPISPPLQVAGAVAKALAPLGSGCRTWFW